MAESIKGSGDIEKGREGRETKLRRKKAVRRQRWEIGGPCHWKSSSELPLPKECTLRQIST
jgi:hypothetical protein